jgi:CelD/BcsL family acetyltransferase involved in cellulose biosynthesis
VTRTTTLTAFPDTSVPLDLPVTRAQRRGDVMRDASPRLTIHIHSDLNTIESEWRRFERVADCTAFQTFDWLATWQRHIGERQGVRPVIVVGRFGDGDIAFIVPLGVERGALARRLCWLGQDLCDYNAPLLARDFSARVTPQV